MFYLRHTLSMSRITFDLLLKSVFWVKIDEDTKQKRIILLLLFLLSKLFRFSMRVVFGRASL